MKTNFKQLGLVAAVAAATAGYAGITQAALSDNGLGDLAIVPYYTVQGDFVSGLHITNTSDATQVVKLRWRRGSDSMDALDFNLIMSPYDVWTGYIDDSSGTITVNTDDSTCTVPIRSGGDFPMNPLYAAGAEEGYIEVIGMGQVAPSTLVPATPLVAAYYTNPMNGSALHAIDGDTKGVPADCAGLESNFYRVLGAPLTPVGVKNGVYNGATTVQTVATGAIGTNTFVDAPNVFKVSYFVRDAASGLEFGSDAVHFADFNDKPMMTNQEKIIVGVADAYSFLFPDLDGGSPGDVAIGATRGHFDAKIRAFDGLGALSVINDWSVAAARNVTTDWVITMPGQYLMLDLTSYTLGGANGTNCYSQTQIDAMIPAPVPALVACDQRDIPVVLNADDMDNGVGVWDREEQTFSNPDGGLVISPEVGLRPNATTLEYEVNVLEWHAAADPNEHIGVFESQYVRKFGVKELDADFGWASLAVSSDPTKVVVGPAIYNFGASGAAKTAIFDPVVNKAIPVVGFVAWERSFPADPSANYGRIVDHSYNTSSVITP